MDMPKYEVGTMLEFDTGLVRYVRREIPVTFIPMSSSNRFVRAKRAQAEAAGQAYKPMPVGRPTTALHVVDYFEPSEPKRLRGIVTKDNHYTVWVRLKGGKQIKVHKRKQKVEEVTA